jgi:hypothetical protein
MKMRQWLLKIHQEQVEWVRQCGGTLSGYISNYCQTHGRSVQETIAIWHADLNELHRIEKKLETRA